MKISVVLPNWNGVTLMKKHLQRVIDAAPGAEIIVADDNSSDGSVEFLEKNFSQVRITTRDTQGGFASNVNSGVESATGDIVILINTDVEPEREFLKPLLDHFKDSEVFAVGCLEKSAENGKIILRGRGLAYWRKGYYIHSRGEVDKKTTAWVSGGSGAFRKSMWEKLGGMDTIYNPFYWEDIDLSYRARKAGWKVLFEPKSVVHHYHEEGKIKREYEKRHVQKIVYRNQFIFIWKNVTSLKIFLEHILWTPVRILQTFIKSDFLMATGFLMALLKIPDIVKRRLWQKKYYKISDIDIALRD